MRMLRRKRQNMQNFVAHLNQTEPPFLGFGLVV
jgi:hypothetical protein